jgi:hypothetical protein
MTRTASPTWRLDRRINLSVLLQLIVLASLILGSWMNLQRQLDLLQHDVAALVQSQKDFQQKLEQLTERSLSYEYRFQALERGENTRDRL